jgi:anthranilate/para-aminobenzoate synthase component I
MRISTRPIKGTVPRGHTPEEDQKFIRELLKSKKNEAELNMIVDLARNDLGRVCEVGSVEVSNHRVVETYSHVHHTVSTVEGVLRSGLDWWDVLRAVFPGGSITGAPKVRTMELIDALEPCSRGVYTGSAGWISPEGEFDFNILIRTIAFSKDPKTGAKGRYSFHSGGAIVVDSKPLEEYEETLHKAAVLTGALTGAPRSAAADFLCSS